MRKKAGRSERGRETREGEGGRERGKEGEGGRERHKERREEGGASKIEKGRMCDRVAMEA